MRDANFFDIKLAEHGDVKYGVMYNSRHGLVHMRQSCGLLAEYMEDNGFILMSTHHKDDLEKFVLVRPRDLRVVEPIKGPSHTSKKPKRKPVKGTKPWTKIPYEFEDVEVGDVVKYKVCGTEYNHNVLSKDAYKWEADNGTGYIQWIPTPSQEAHILKPYKEPVKDQEKKTSKPDYYRIGDRFETSDGYKVMLCRIQALKAQLIVYEGSNTGRRWCDRTLDIHSDSTVKARDVLEYGSLVGVSIKKI